MSKPYVLEDPRPIARAAPYTFFLPCQEQLDLVSVGDRVYLDFRAVPTRTKWESERMWVVVTALEGLLLRGVLSHEPDDIPGLHEGDVVDFERWHILQLDYQQLAQANRIVPDARREYWERCLVDEAVLSGELKVGFLYREEPDPARRDDPNPDSGWRIRGDLRHATDEEIASREAHYVALGAVLNLDDSWLPLIDEPAGAAFERDFERNVYVRASVQ